MPQKTNKQANKKQPSDEGNSGLSQTAARGRRPAGICGVHEEEMRLKLTRSLKPDRVELEAT